MKRTVSAMELRRGLGGILERVFYNDDEVLIERNGRLLAVIIPPGRYQALERSREELNDMIRESWERNRDADPDEVERDVEAAIRAVRQRARKTRQSRRAS